MNHCARNGCDHLGTMHEFHRPRRGALVELAYRRRCSATGPDGKPCGCVRFVDPSDPAAVAAAGHLPGHATGRAAS